MPTARASRKQSSAATAKSPYGSIRIERGIYRVHYPSHKGIRVYLKFRDTIYQKVFSFVGGEKRTLARARRWRKERLQEIQNSPAAQNPLRNKQSNNISGIAGVRRGKTAWSATWVEKNTQRHRSFAVGRHGEKEAFRLACQARADAEIRLYGKIWQPALEHALKGKYRLPTTLRKNAL